MAPEHPLIGSANDDTDVDTNQMESIDQVVQVPVDEYYNEYYGHKIAHLQIVHDQLRRLDMGTSQVASGGDTSRSAIFLLGDSSLDNKFWFHDRAPAINGYAKVLSSTRSRAVMVKKDIAYCFNKVLEEKHFTSRWFCLNTAVEESTLADRFSGRLLAHDEFVRDNLQQDDIAIISVGGNDIALRPSIKTIANMIALLLQPLSWIESGSAVGLGHFVSLFKDKVEQYIQSVVVKHKPRLVVVCMIYFPDCQPGGSWADKTLRLLGYNSNPKKLQTLIRKIFTIATRSIQVDGVEIVPFPLYEILDGATSSDYCQRVEPSAQGGKKIASAMIDELIQRWGFE